MAKRKPDCDEDCWAWWCVELGWLAASYEREFLLRNEDCYGLGHEDCGPRRVRIVEVKDE